MAAVLDCTVSLSVNGNLLFITICDAQKEHAKMAESLPA